MAGGSQLLKRIPRIKFPNRHLQTSSGSGSGSASSTPAVDVTFLSNLKASASLGGKASMQPKRTPVSKQEIEAILLGGSF